MGTLQKLIFFDTFCTDVEGNQINNLDFMNKHLVVPCPTVYRIIEDIPREMIANNKYEADVLVQIKYRWQSIGYYEHTSVYGHQTACTIQIINRWNSAILSSRDFPSELPPDKIYEIQDQRKKETITGAYRYNEMKEYLNHKILDQKIYLKKGVPEKMKLKIGCLITILLIVFLIISIIIFQK